MRNKIFLFVLGIVFLVNFVSFVSAVQYANCAAVPISERGSLICQEVFSCGLLSTANRYYLLMNNISSNYTCFETIGIDNSVINLNEYEITYNNVNVVFSNRGFETGDFTGWNTVNAPTATVVADPGTYMLEDYYARITATSPQYISSPLIHLPDAGQTYVAYSLPKGGETYVEVVDSLNNQLCRAEGTISPAGKFMQFCLFATTQPTDVYLRFGTTSSDGLVRDFDLVGLGSKYDYGVMVRSAPDVDNVNTDNSLNVTIKNGIIRQGRNAGVFSHAINLGGGGIDDCEVYNITTYTNGVDSVDIMLMGGKNTEVAYNEIHNNVAYTSDREDSYAMIEGPDQQGQTNLRIHDNKLFGGVQGGIHAGSKPNSTTLFSGDTIEVYNNYIELTSKTTNGYAIIVTGNNTRIYNNVVNATNGRGIGLGFKSSNQSIFNNYVNVIEKTPPEYPTLYNGPCAHGMKLEFDSAYSSGQIYNNTVISRTGPGTWGACPLSVGFGFNKTVALPLILIENNTFISQYGVGSEPLAYSAAIQYFGKVPQVVLKNNRFYSDHILLMMWGGDITDNTADGSLFISNVFEKTYPEKSPFSSIFISTMAGPNNYNSEFIDSTFIDGSYDDIQVAGNWNFTVGWFLDVIALDGVSSANNALLQVFDKNNNLVFSATMTDGTYQTNLTETYYYGNPTVNKINYNNYTVNVTYLGETQSRKINLTSSRTEVFNFNAGPCPDANLDGVVNIKDLAIVIFNQGRSATGNYAHLDFDESGGVINWDDVSYVVNRMGESC